MKKFILSLVITIIAICALKAQDEAIYNHYVINPILINPAYAGFKEAHSFMFNARAGWVSFPKTPKTIQASYNGPIGKTLGVGVGFLNENIAHLTRQRVQLNYAFRSSTDILKFSAGFSTEFERRDLNNSVTENMFYEEGDEIVTNNLDGYTNFDATLGAFVRFKEATFAGFSLPNLISNRLDEIETGTGGILESYIFQLGHEFEVDEFNFKVEPSLMFRQLKNTPSQVDINVLTKFNDEQLFAGISYHAGAGGALGVILGAEVSGLNIFFTYDVSFNQFQKYNLGSYEALIAFDLYSKNKAKNAKR